MAPERRTSGVPHGADPAGLRLGPATRLLWRAPDSVHLEMGGRGVVVEGLPPGSVGMLVARRRAVAPAPVEAGEPAQYTALGELVRSGYLWRRSDDEADAAGDLRRTPPVPRLATELSALAARHGEQAGELLNARRHASVVVHGDNGPAVQLATLLAAAGVGRVRCAVSGTARLVHAAPGGVNPRDEGKDLAAAADTAIRAAAPEANTAPLPDDEPADLTILAGGTPIDDDRRSALHAAGAAHLVVTAAAAHGVVGPLVLPGLTSCLRCADLHRRDRDPAWPVLAVQLTVGRDQPFDLALAGLVVGMAGLQALAFLDGGEPACIDGTLELHLPDWRVRRRSWPPHPDCDCTPAG